MRKSYGRSRRGWTVTMGLPGRNWPRPRRWLAGIALVILMPAAILFVRSALVEQQPWRRTTESAAATALSESPSAGTAAAAQFDYWAVAGPAAGSGADLCGTPGWPDPRWYARLDEEDLPWTASPPAELEALRTDHGARRLIAAFRTTLSDPLFDEQFNIGHAAQMLAGQTVGSGEVFSVNDAVGPYTGARGYRLGPSYVGGQLVPSEGGGVCKISTALYNLATFGGLEVVERHPHSLLVPYVPPGRDATVAWAAKDFRFRNSSDRPLVIWAVMDELTLYAALYGDFEPPSVEWTHKVLSSQETWTIRQPSDKLQPGDEKVLMAGYPGMTVRTWVVTTAPGKQPEKRDLGIDTYLPLPRVVEYGP